MSNVLYAGAALAALLYFNSTSSTPEPTPTTPVKSDATQYVPYTPITDPAPVIASPLDTGSGVTPATQTQIDSYKTGKCLMNGVQHPKLLLNNYLFWNKDAATCFQMTGAVQLPDGTYTAPVTYQNADGSITKPPATSYYSNDCWCARTETNADFGYQYRTLSKSSSCSSCADGSTLVDWKPRCRWLNSNDQWVDAPSTSVFSKGQIWDVTTQAGCSGANACSSGGACYEWR